MNYNIDSELITSVTDAPQGLIHDSNRSNNDGVNSTLSMNPCLDNRSATISPSSCGCPTGPTGPPGLPGSSGRDARQNSDYIFDNRSVVLASTGDDLTFKIGDMNAPALSIDAILPLVRLGEVTTIHMLSGTHNISINNVSNLHIINWGPSGIGTVLVDECSDITFIDVIANDVIVINISSNVRFRSSTLTSLECTNSSSVEFRDCSFIDPSVGDLGIQLNATSEITFQSNSFNTESGGELLDVIDCQGIFRDNLIVGKNLSAIIRDPTMDQQRRILITHNTFITESSPEISRHLTQKIYNNSFHNFSPSPRFITGLDSFNHISNYNSNSIPVSNIDMGTRANGLIRKTLISNNGNIVYLSLETPSVILVQVNTYVILPRGPPDGMVIDVIAQSNCTIGANGVLMLVVSNGGTPTAYSVSAGRSVRLQYSKEADFWITSVRVNSF